MKKVALLDVNVLLALSWPNHQDHSLAQNWFFKNARLGWATCAFTELGFIRLSSNPAYTSQSKHVTPPEAAELLQQLTQHAAHHFWKSPSAASVAIYKYALGHQQVNDAWLVAVARANRGRLVTLDRRLPVHASEDGVVEVIGR